MRHAATAVVLLLLLADSAAGATKTDVVELRNGDRITCEIRKLERGKLTVKTDGLGTIAVEWDDVERVSSKASYDVELESGLRLFGSLERSDADAVLVGAAPGGVRALLREIVRIAPVGGTLWRRLDGSVNAGFSFAQANVQTDWSLATEVSYRSRRWLSQLQGDSALTIREDADRQSRNSVTLRSQRFLGRRWSALGFGQFQQNEELSLELRALVGAGVERRLVQSNRTVLAAVGGVASSNEQVLGRGSRERRRGGRRADLELVHLRRALHQPRGGGPLVLRHESPTGEARADHQLQERHRRRSLLEHQPVRELQQRSAGEPEEERFRNLGHGGMVVLKPVRCERISRRLT